MSDIISILTLIVSIISAIYAFQAYQKMIYPDGMKIFEGYLKDKKNWEKEYLEDKVIWRYILNTDYEFEVKFMQKWESQEPWIPNFPDTSKGKEEVNLFIKGKSIMSSILFISLDGGRFFIPVPEIGPNSEYLWRKSSLAYQLNNIIGEYPGGVYPKDIESFSKQYNINLL